MHLISHYDVSFLHMRAVKEMIIKLVLYNGYL